MPEVQITLSDVGELFKINPLAAEQAKVIALQRILTEKEAALEKLRDVVTEQA